MDYRHLGRSGLLVSPLCLGTMNFGSQTEEAESFAIMDRALEVGINFFDTANGYGGGETEQILGRWFAKGGGRREKVVLATKVYGDVAGDWPNDSKLSARHIRDACEASLRRLQTDHIDLYQMHHVDRGTPWEEIWQAMELLVAQGKVIYVGSSNFAAWHIVAANESARQRHSFGLVSEQSLYNLKTRTIELEVIPACEAYGIGILPWSPLGSGLLAGSIAEATEGRRANEGMKAAVDWLRDTIDCLGEALFRARRASGRRGPRLAARQPGRDRPDHRSSHHRTIRRQPSIPRDRARPRGAFTAGPDLPRPRSCP